jgi:hypothetical protein
MLTSSLLVVGTTLSLFIIFFKVDGNRSWSWILLSIVTGPWLIVDVLLLWLKQFMGIAIAGALMLALEVAIYYYVFISPDSPTETPVYLVKPFLQLLLLLPIGLLIGRIIDNRVNTK